MRSKDPKDMSEAERIAEAIYQEDFFRHLTSHLPVPEQPLFGWRKVWSHIQRVFDYCVKVFVGTFLWLVAASIVLKIFLLFVEN